MASFWQTSTAETTPALQLSRRYLLLHLPRWATDCLRRAEPALAATGRPLALWERQRGAMRLVAVDVQAAALGLSVGQSVSDARALVTALEVREIDVGFCAQTFADFADWHSNASPIVAVLGDAAPWGDLVLDISGVAHLFGGEAAMRAKLVGRLEALGFTVKAAIASSVGAAWALAHFTAGGVLPEGEERTALAPLPVAALRLEDRQVAGLKTLGLQRIGQLLGRDRRALAARFGATLLLRLDQALGGIEEKVTPRLPAAEHYVERRFADPIGLIDDVLMTAADLAVSLGIKLEAMGLGAQAFHLFLYCVDHRLITLSINAARATRDAGHIARLFQFRAERLGGEYDPGFGIDMIRLAASSLSPLEAAQVSAYGVDDGAATLDRLYDRMSSRLGPSAVLRTRAVNSYLPEQAVVLDPAIAPQGAPLPVPPVAAPRPLRLLPQPEPIIVLAEVPDAPPASMVWRRVSYRFVKASGPERIGADWRHSALPITFGEMPGGGQNYVEGGETRDYYVAEDDGGRRFWLFRLGLFGIAAAPRWYLHGFFA
jgi:protein ImuB